MKKIYGLLAMLAMLLVLTGCATSTFSSRVGTEISNNYAKSYEIGSKAAANADKFLFVRGQIKGAMGEYVFANRLSPDAKDVIDVLTTIAQKKDRGEELTKEEKGRFSTAIIRLEVVAVRDLWDTYGGNITKYIQAFIGAM